MQAQQKIRVMLADDHPIVMQGFGMALAGFNIDIVAHATTPQEAVDVYGKVSPDVLVLDIRFGEQMTGLDAAQSLLKSHPDARIVFLSQFDQDSLIKETYRLGGRAFVTKDCDPAELANAVKRAHQGELYFMPQIAERLASLAVKGDVSPQSQLDERDLEVFKMMAEGLTNVEIAEKLKLSAKTISNTSQSIKEKLGVHRPALITKLAVKYGLIAP